jgi:hypothetical protein
MIRFLIILYTLTIITSINNSYSQQVGFHGQAVGSLAINPSDPFQILAGTRYLPKLTYLQTWDKGYKLDAEVSLNAWGS